MAKGTLKTFTLTFVLFQLSCLVLSQGTGTQFITGPCTSDADCASGCCGFNSGKCAGAIIAQERDGGCGFGDSQPNDNAARILRGEAPDSSSSSSGSDDTSSSTSSSNTSSSGTDSSTSTSTSTGSGKAPGTQFITGPCSTDSDCADGCCGFNTGLCAGPIIAQERDGGCGHGDAQPNANAANALTGGTGSTSTATATAAAPAAAATQTTTTTSSSTGSGKPPGTQFITGPCSQDSDCADGCCGFNTGKCAGPVVAQERDGGCGHGDAQPNANAANALTGGGNGSKKKRWVVSTLTTAVDDREHGKRSQGISEMYRA